MLASQDGNMDTEDTPPTISSLPQACLEEIFSYLDPKSLCLLACACTEFHSIIASMPDPWRSLCTDKFAVAEKADDSSWYGTWRELAVVVPGQEASSSTGFRARSWWSEVKAFCQRSDLGAVAATLNPPATPEAIEKVERTLGVAFPECLKMLYRVHDGQSTEIDRLIDSQQDHGLHPSIFQGLLGGYSFYDHLVSVRFLPLQRLLRYTRMCRDNRIITPDSGLVLIAASWNFAKLFFLDTLTGRLHVSQADKRYTFPASPESSDGLMQWLEEYLHRLKEGTYSVQRLIPDMEQSRGINLFPQRAPYQSVAVTQGIVVKASALFIPEQTVTRGLQPRYQFAYSVRYCLQDLEEQAARSPHKPVTTSAQLATRHWLIKDARGIVTGEVRGEGVVGEYPLLKPGQPDYVYQSCTHQTTLYGSMEGDFHFKLGTLDDPKGEVDAVCARFPLDVPETFIF